MQCNATHWTEYKITSTCPVSGVRPASVDKTVTLFIASLYLTGVNVFCAVRSEVEYAHARPLFDCHSQLKRFAETINVVFAKSSCFCVDYFNKMAELVCVTVFHTHMLKKLTKRQKLRKPNDFRQANETLLRKIITVFARWRHVGAFP